MLYGLEKESSSSSQRPVTFHQTTWCHIHWDANLRKLLRLHFIFCNTIKFFWPHAKLIKSFFLPLKFNQHFIKIYISNISRNRYQKEGRQRTRNLIFGRVRATIFAEETRKVLYILRVRQVSSMQFACAVLLPVACPALPIFSHFISQKHNFRGKKWLLNMKCVF